MKTVKILHPSKIENLPVGKIGAKAKGLLRLNRLGLNVPNFGVLEVAKPPVEIGILSLQNFIKLLSCYPKLAVRSGAPVSMPGMLKTRFVSSGDIDAVIAAVEEVYASWDSPEAVAYREDNGIPDYGTAVVVQGVPEGIVYSGVAFTCDPTEPEGKEYQPIVEYVVGMGEALVGGEKTARRASWEVERRNDPRFAALYHGLHEVHESLGPSDIEFCITSGAYGCCYFLQHRPLKFAANPVPEEPEKSKGKVLVTGVPIGAPVVVRVRAKDILVLDGFRPDEYPRMRRAAGIVTATGSTTCHAAIVARALGKPAAVMPFFYEELLLGKEEVVFDGRSGEIRAVAVVEEAVPTVPTVPTTLRKLHAAGVERFIRSVVDVNVMCLRTYEAIESGDRKSLELYAEVLSGYMFLAVTAEARHAARVVEWKGRTRDALRALGIFESTDLERTPFLGHLTFPTVPKEQLRWLGVLYALYAACTWSGSAYGGRRWAEITRHLVLYVAGVYDEMLFLDGAFNLRHNGSPMFDKFRNTTYDFKLLDQQLDAKRDGGLNKLKKVSHELTLENYQAVGECGYPFLEEIVGKCEHVTCSKCHGGSEGKAEDEEDEAEEECDCGDLDCPICHPWDCECDYCLEKIAKEKEEEDAAEETVEEVAAGFGNDDEQNSNRKTDAGD